MVTNNYFSFLRLISKTIIGVSAGVLKLVRIPAGIYPLRYTSKLPLRLFISSRKVWWKPGITNCVVGKDESGLVSATINVNIFLD